MPDPSPPADSAAPASDPGPAPGTSPPPRRAPRWALPVFLLLLAGLVVANYAISRSGPAIAWIDNDLPAALRQAVERKQRVFLYIYEPNDPLHARNERLVFSESWARTPLRDAVACRIAVQPHDRLALRFNYSGKPVFVLLDEQGRPIAQMRVEGAPDEREFFTYIGSPLRDYAERATPP